MPEYDYLIVEEPFERKIVVLNKDWIFSPSKENRRKFQKTKSKKPHIAQAFGYKKVKEARAR